MFAAYHQMCQPTTSSSTVSTSRRADALPPTGSVHLAGQGRPGYNRWKRITAAQSTRYIIGAGSLVVEVAMPPSLVRRSSE